MSKPISPLTWPGGKSKKWNLIKEQLPNTKISKFFDLFLGGGSVLLNAMNEKIADYYYGSDIDNELINFWRTLQIEASFDEKKFQIEIPNSLKHAREIYETSTKAEQFFIDNALTFGGFRKGTWSQLRLEQNFTQSKIQKLNNAINLFKENHVFLKESNYNQRLLNFVGEKKNNYIQNWNAETCFVFLDPPYFYNQKTKIYKHSTFDFIQFKQYVDNLNAANIKFLITIDNSPEVRELFKKYIFIEQEWKYTSSNSKGNSNCKVGKELFIRNYHIKQERITSNDY